MHTRPIVLWAVVLAGCTVDPALAPPSSGNPPRAALAALQPFPDVITLPHGFAPEGIAFGRGSTFYVGSTIGGAIYKGDARTGTGSLLVTAQGGAGMKYDARGDRIFVAGGFSGEAYVYSAATGATLAVYSLTAPGAELINDVVLTRDAAYFTNSGRAALYRVPFGPGGELPPPEAVEEIALTGDFVHVAGDFNANGIVAVPNERQLILVNTATGRLYLVDARTGVASEIDVGGATLTGGDGLLLIGNTLYVVRGDVNQIAVVRLSGGYTSGVVERVITHPELRFPSTIAGFGSALYVVNARFDAIGYPDVEFQVVRVSRF